MTIAGTNKGSGFIPGSSSTITLEFIKALLEHMDDGVIACDHERKVTVFNRKVREWYGGGLAPVAPERWADTYFLFEADEVNPLSEEQNPLLLAFSGKAVKDQAFVIKVPGRPVRHVVSGGGPLTDKDGSVRGAFLVMKDVTTQVRHNRELTDERSDHRQMLDMVPDVLIETDLMGNIIFINEVLVAKGYIASKSELIGHSLFEFVIGEERERAIKRFRDFPNNNPGTMEYNVKFANGRAVVCDVKGNLLHDTEGNPKGIVFILRDLTEKRKAENQLRMLAHTMQSISECICITDISNNIVYVNQAFVKTYGYEEEELKGRNISMVRSHGNDEEVIASIYPETLIGGWEGELMNIRKDGREFPINLSTSAVRAESGEISFLVGISKDITFQKEAEKELQDSRARFKKFFENTTVGFCITSPTKGWIEVNSHLCQMLGYTKEELKNLTWAELTHPEDLQADVDLFEQMINGRIDYYDLDKRFIRKDKSIVHISLYAAAERKPDGTLKHILASLVDISSRKMAEEVIKASEKRFREMANFLPVAIYEADMNGRLTFANQVGYEWFGMTAEDLEKGINFVSFLDPDNKKTALDKFSSIVTNRITSSGEYLLKRYDGSVFHSIITSRVVEAEGQVTGIRGVIVDISDRVRAEELRVAHEAAQVTLKAQRHLSLLVDQSLVGFIELDTDLNIIAWNPSAQRIFGYAASEVIGKKLPEIIIEPVERSRVTDNMKKVLDNRHGYRNINRNITKDGRVITCEWHDTALVDTDGSILSIISLVADITERIESERVLKESQEKLKSFAAQLQSAIEEERIQISRELHDSLGQSLTGLKIYASRLRGKTARYKEGNMDQILEGFDEVIQIIDSLMKQVRSIAKKLRPRILDEMGLIPAIESHLDEFVKYSGINCRFYKELDSIPISSEKKIEVYRIIQESLTNVLRHAKASEVRVSVTLENGKVNLRVSDNGIGFHEDILTGPRGIGLLGMKERAASIGGNLEINGIPKKGTTVTLAIPFDNDYI